MTRSAFTTGTIRTADAGVARSEPPSSRVLRGAWVVAICAIAGAGCATTYIPRNNGRVSMVMRGSNLAYYRNGRTITPGFFGAGLSEAVQGHPEAERAARDHVNGRITGFALNAGGTVVGFVAIGVILGFALSGNANTGMMVGLPILAGGMALSVGGLSAYLAAEPRLLDAINIFNDGAGETTCPTDARSSSGARERVLPSLSIGGDGVEANRPRGSEPAGEFSPRPATPLPAPGANANPSTPLPAPR